MKIDHTQSSFNKALDIKESVISEITGTLYVALKHASKKSELLEILLSFITENRGDLGLLQDDADENIKLAFALGWISAESFASSQSKSSEMKSASTALFKKIKEQFSKISNSADVNMEADDIFIENDSKISDNKLKFVINIIEQYEKVGIDGMNIEDIRTLITIMHEDEEFDVEQVPSELITVFVEKLLNCTGHECDGAKPGACRIYNKYLNDKK